MNKGDAAALVQRLLAEWTHAAGLYAKNEITQADFQRLQRKNCNRILVLSGALAELVLKDEAIQKKYLKDALDHLTLRTPSKSKKEELHQ